MKDNLIKKKKLIKRKTRQRVERIWIVKKNISIARNGERKREIDVDYLTDEKSVKYSGRGLQVFSQLSVNMFI